MTNKLDTTILSFKNFQEIIEDTSCKELGKQMVCDLLGIAQLTGQPIKHMTLNQAGVFEEVNSRDRV